MLNRRIKETEMFGQLNIVLGVIIVVVVGAFATYFHYSQNQIATLHESNAKLTLSVQMQEQTIAQLQEHAKRQQEALTSLQQTNNQAETQHKTLQQRLRAQNLQAQAKQNAQETQKTINQDTQDFFRSLEQATKPATASKNP
jgi:cell division protein FtsN